MKLKQLREASGYYQREIVKATKAIDCRVDSGLYSKIENGVTLPTPQMLRQFCRMFDCEPLDIYEKFEIDLTGCMSLPEAPRPKKRDRHRITRKATFRLSEWACKSLEMHRLRALGYLTKSDWFYDQIRKTNRAYAEIVKRQHQAAQKRPG